MSRKIPKEMTEYWESQLKGVDKPLGHREVTFDPAILSIIQSSKSNGKVITTVQRQKILAGFYRMFSELTNRQKETLTMYFGLDGSRPMKEREIAQEMGVSQQEVCKLIQKGKAQLKKKIEVYVSTLNISTK